MAKDDVESGRRGLLWGSTAGDASWCYQPVTDPEVLL